MTRYLNTEIPKGCDVTVYCENHHEPGKLGIIMLDTSFPRIVGDIGNPKTFDFPVQYEVVAGASPERIVLQADRDLINPFIEAGQRLINNGARILTTSCGFLVLFQIELSSALCVPVLSSSLLQIDIAKSMIKKDQRVGVITANKLSLTASHLAVIGVEIDSVEIVGMEHSEEFSSVFLGEKQTLNVKKCSAEMEEVASKLISSYPDIGAIVLECTNMPPYSNVVRKVAGGRSVFDIVTMINYAYSTLDASYLDEGRIR